MLFDADENSKSGSLRDISKSDIEISSGISMHSSQIDLEK